MRAHAYGSAVRMPMRRVFALVLFHLLVHTPRQRKLARPHPSQRRFRRRRPVARACAWQVRFVQRVSSLASIVELRRSGVGRARRRCFNKSRAAPRRPPS
eukprot:6183581-Pleurochrysis_carterae.AAC.2